MATGDINTAEQCLKAIDAIKQELANARKGLLNSETCLVNRSLMQAQRKGRRNNPCGDGKQEE